MAAAVGGHAFRVWVHIMKSTRTATSALDGSFLETRCKIIEIAANLDRIAQATDASNIAADRRMSQLTAALAILLDGNADKARRCQMAFSLPYEEGWHDRFKRS